VIRITRQSARKAAIKGFFGLGILAATAFGQVNPAAANYQSGVDAYYRGEFAVAMDAWRPLAEAGDPVAQNSIGALYDHGLGVPEDNFEAARWYEMAAQQGMPLAMRNLANQYATGHGLPYDTEMARQWYERAAALGDRQSASLLRQLGPAAGTVAAAPATPAFSTPTTTGQLAVPVDNAAPAEAATTGVSNGSGDLVISGVDSGNAQSAAATPALPDQGIALDIGGQTVTMGGATPAPTPAPAQPATIQAATTEPVQQAAVIAPVQRSDGNWLIGQWQGPSLGCPKGGGIEFTEGETLSWFDGEVAVRMGAAYQISGERIVVTSTASDGSSQVYTYQRESADRMIITTIPDSMPQSMIGIAYRRCGAAPSDTTATAGVIEIPANGQIPAAAPAVESAAVAAPAAAPAVAPAGATAADGWAAFEQGNPQMALAIFTSLAEAGDASMQVQVGQMYDFGQGVPQDDAEALNWYLRAAEAGNNKAQYQAGMLYFRSPSVPQDPVQAYRWLTLASQGTGPNAIPAKSMLNDLDRQMTDEQLSQAKQLLKPAN
jgi:TPR repeat protein